jgi:hypothetical protein
MTAVPVRAARRHREGARFPAVPKDKVVAVGTVGDVVAGEIDQLGTEGSQGSGSCVLHTPVTCPSCAA